MSKEQRFLFGKLMVVDDVMKKIEHAMGIKAKDQKLFFNGAPLEEKGDKLGDLEISDGDTIFDEPVLEKKKKPKPKASEPPPPLGDELLDQKGMTESEATNDAIAEHKMTNDICFDMTLLSDTPNAVAPLPNKL